MAGFIVSYTTGPDKVQPKNAQQLSIGERVFYVHSVGKNQCYQKHDANSFIIIDGYSAKDDLSDLVAIVENKAWSLLKTLEGHFSGLLITEDNIIAFNDRYGGKNIYWQLTDSEQIIFTSQLVSMPLHNTKFNTNALYEALHYRWTTGESTLLAGVNKLPIRHSASFTDKGDVQLQPYWQLPSPKPSKLSLNEKVDKTEQALINRLLQAREKHDNVAIFLSGGVDSSILAALAKPIFKQCCLITPVFKGLANPELETAKKFAKSLALPHHLIEIEPDKLLTDFECLVALKREPLRHYSSLAMMAMMRAIPDEYDAVLYGEAADTLYGSNGIKRVITHFKWKKQSQYIPNFALKFFKKIIPGRGRVLLDLKQRTLRDIVLSVTKLNYSKNALVLVDELLKQYTTSQQSISWSWQQGINDINAMQLRHVAQERILNSDAATHFAEAELIAHHFNKEIISPFFATQSIELSSTLAEKDYFGDKFVKPVLRELACKFFSRELIYQKKHGFPVPFVDWLKGPLQLLVTEVTQEKQLFDGDKLKKLSIEDDFEIYWLLINLSLLVRHLEHSSDDSVIEDCVEGFK